jgi:hypothetical protein
MKEPKPTKTGDYTYPSNRQLQAHAERLFAHKFNKHMPDEVKEALKLFQACLYKSIPYFDKVNLFYGSLKVTDAETRAYYGKDWDRLPKQFQNKILKQRDRAAAQRKEQMALVGEFLNHHAREMLGMRDEQIEELEQLADQLAA